ncbi:MAG: uracil-DNA glycosylase family protein [Gammaproteobacteria bacterium]|nr:uracil-DNA glycosylase family protein [Gammaproteobacteria bacterium]
MKKTLIEEIRACTLCKAALPKAPRPVLQFSSTSPIVIIGQAPGLKVHESRVPWNDASGKRLREWLGVDADTFYCTRHFSIVPMGFCYPGRGKSGDLPPRPECAETWMQAVLKSIQQKKLLILTGQYSQQYFLQELRRPTLTETVGKHHDYLPDYFVLPHPSPRNNIWLKKNPWFENEVIPELQALVKRLLKDVAKNTCKK